MERLREYVVSHTIPGRGSRYRTFQQEDYEEESLDPPPYTPPPVIMQTKPTFWSPRKAPPSNHTLWRRKRRKNCAQAITTINQSNPHTYSTTVTPDEDRTGTTTMWMNVMKPRYPSFTDAGASDILPLTFTLAGPLPPPYSSSSSSRSDVITTRHHERQQGDNRFAMQELPTSSRHAVVYDDTIVELALIDNHQDRNKCSIM